MNFTNYITNYVYVFPTNAIPVTIVYDWNNQLSLFWQGALLGAMVGGVMAAVWAVKRALRAPDFPS